eukprot:CAMPEP_0114526094 /NCGR_PEP_ID=MMETSP0109-20121206/22812_1 /TAXON_ID=29199 /ORGANISM="Chlorarachnion reptans, Strain CCCM449" /LENGTH=309 /DNA_ID=CAMNT_0001707795 /DNA_START=67 /DNA_END=996 /DNA_ORIENTATION=-
MFLALGLLAAVPSLARAVGTHTPLSSSSAFSAAVTRPMGRAFLAASSSSTRRRLLRDISGLRGAAEASEAQRIKTPRWDGPGGVCEFLNGQGLQSLEPTEVARRMKQGWVLVDVRRSDQFQESRAAGSENVELFQLLPMGGSPRNVVKYLLTSSQGATPVDPNPSFLDEVLDIVGRRGVRGVIFADAEGGCLDDADGRLGQYGCSSRSLIAAYRTIVEAGLGVQQVGHLKYGLNNWFDSDLPGEGEFEWLPEARTPSGGLGKSKSVQGRREKLAAMPKWRRYLDAFGGLTMAEEAMRGNTRRKREGEGE